MRIVVTGATGNIGTAVLRRLGADGHELTGVARRLPDPDGEADDLGVDWQRVDWRSIDLTADTAVSGLTEAFRGADAVVHLAWGFQPSHDLRQLAELGVGGTHRVLAAITAAGVPHLVHLSSLGVYSPKHDDAPVDESWPTDGVPTSPYSRHKVAAERLLDEHEADGPGTLVTRLRPGIVGQAAASSAQMRYGLPGIVPAGLLRLLPVLPLDRSLRVSMVHAGDVADAVARVLDQRAVGAFNLAADPPITTDRIAEALGARPVHVPSGVLHWLAWLSWRAHLQPIDGGWLDMAFALPLLDSGRARRELGWAPTKDAVEVLHEVVENMRRHTAGPTPVLRERTVPQALKDFATRGPVDERDRP